MNQGLLYSFSDVPLSLVAQSFTLESLGTLAGIVGITGELSPGKSPYNYPHIPRYYQACQITHILKKGVPFIG